jgi:hypothetical protein
MSNLYNDAYEAGVSFDRFLKGAQENRALWHALADRVEVAREAEERVRAVPGCWRILVLADDWCGDAINTVPVVAALADAAPGVDLRIVPRDRFPELRDRHLTGGSRSIPIVILLDDQGTPRGSWGPRPGVLQERFQKELRSLPQGRRYRELRKWYARDRGTTTADEIANLFEAASARVPRGLLEPCVDARAA